MIQKISANELVPGMRVANPNFPWLSNPFLYTTEGVVATKGEIDQILANGFLEVYIEISTDPALAGKDVTEIIQEKIPETKIVRFDKANPTVLLEKELPVARALYDDSVRFAHNTILSLQNGQELPLEQGTKIVGEILDSITRNYNALLGIVKLRVCDEYTYTHCINVCTLSTLLSVQIGFEENAVKEVGLAGLFHDIGKANIPKSILNKKGKLTDAEFEVIKNHPDLGIQHVLHLNLPKEIISGIRDHHEKINGEGYPRGLKGKEISQTARIISIVDVYDALTSRRVYKKPMIAHQALSLMYSMKDKDFDGVLIEQFIRSQGIYPVGSVVKLSSGWSGVVVQINPEKPLFPKISLIRNPLGHNMYEKEIIDLSQQDQIKVIRVMTPSESGIDPTSAIPFTGDQQASKSGFHKY